MDGEKIKITNPEEALSYLGQFVDEEDYLKLDPAVKAVIYDKARQNSKYKDYTDAQFQKLKPELDQLRDVLEGAILEKISPTLPKTEESRQIRTLEEREKIRKEAEASAEKSVKELKSRATKITEGEVMPPIIHVVPVGPLKTVNLTPEEATDLLNLSQAAARDPRFPEKFAEKLSGNGFRKFATVDFAEKLIDVDTQLKPLRSKEQKIKALSSIQQAPQPVGILKAVSEKYPGYGVPSVAVAAARSQDKVVETLLSQKEFDLRNTMRALYGASFANEKPIEFIVVDEPAEGSIEIDAEKTKKIARDYEEERRKREEEVNRPGINPSEIKKLADRDWVRIFQGFRGTNFSQARNTVSDIVSAVFPAAETAIPTSNTTLFLAAYTGRALGYQSLAPALFSSWRTAGLLTAETNGVMLLPAIAGQAAYSQPTMLLNLTLGQNFLRAATIEKGTQVFLGVAGKAGAKEFQIIATKVGAKLAVRVTTTAAAGAAGAGAGVTIGQIVIPIPVIGAIIGAVVGFVSDLFVTKILPWIKEHLEGIAIGAIALGILGMLINPFVGIPLLMVGGSAAVASGLTVGGFFGGLAGAVGAIFTGAILPGIAAPIIGFLIGFPLLVALILFVINAGAYVVPPGNPIGGIGGVGPISGQVDVYGRCPLTGNHYIGTGSLNNGVGHGSEAYWTVNGVVTPPKDRYAIPIWAQFPKRTQFPNGCVDIVCPYYGFAIDVHPTQTSPAPDNCETSPNTGSQVITPKICGVGSTCDDLQWQVLGIIPHPLGWGIGAVLSATGNGHTYQMYLAHMDIGAVLANPILHRGTLIKSGTILAPLSNAICHPHVHVELNVDGAPVRPEFLCQ